MDGTIDWYCCPRFDSSSVFAALLDDADEGRFGLRADDPEVKTRQFYLPDTNVLIPGGDADRGGRDRRLRGLPADLARWQTSRDTIYRRVMSDHRSDGRRSFVQHDRNDALDAAVLMMPLAKFIAPTDPRWLSTLAALENELVVDSLVYRYDSDRSPDGLPGREGTFSMCSF